MAIVVLAWGLVPRDGLVVALGLGLSALAAAVVIAGSTALVNLAVSRFLTS